MVCSKQPFYKRKDARATAKVLSKQNGRPYRAYKCLRCDNFHLTTKTDERSKYRLKEAMRVAKFGKHGEWKE